MSATSLPKVIIVLLGHMFKTNYAPPQLGLAQKGSYVVSTGASLSYNIAILVDNGSVELPIQIAR